MPQIVIDIPDDLLLALREQPTEVAHTARLAELTRLEFLDLLAVRGVPAFDLPVADASAEIVAGRRKFPPNCP